MNKTNRYQGRKVAILAATSVTGVVGGAELLNEGLVEALRALGSEPELIGIPIDESSFESILQNYAHCEGLDLSGYDVVISTKAPTYAVKHRAHVAYLVHTHRVFYDMFDEAFPNAGPDDWERRAHIHFLDTRALSRAKWRFSIGEEVSTRLRRWNGLDAEVAYPGFDQGQYRNAGQGDYFLLPGRLHRWKRVHLAIEALKGSDLSARLVITGTGEDEASLKALAAGDPRIEFRGRVEQQELVELYAHCLGVIFVPLREDYGYVTLESFASSKPVITCRDSGETTQFVRDGSTGLVADPNPSSLRAAMERLSGGCEEVHAMGLAGRESIRDITWQHTAKRLLDAGLGLDAVPRESPPHEKTRVAILDMQPIDPPVGGGRIRLLGLYHALGEDIEARYVGTYDWPGMPYRQHYLSPSLMETDIPLSDAHHAAAQRLADEAGGKVVIDLAFGQQGLLSPEFVDAAKEAVAWADVVVFSHPWVFPLVESAIRTSQVVVYDSQNVEGFLRAQLLDSANPVERNLLRGVIRDEYLLGLRSDLILTCSEEDRIRFADVYEWPMERMRVFPNGVMISDVTPPSPEERRDERGGLGIDSAGIFAIFIGSGYGPNTVAAMFIATELAKRVPKVIFVIAGGVGDTVPEEARVVENVIVTGRLDEDQKLRWLRACDFAVNPMFAGSGTNIKMFDFMAAGLPVITTAIGARGVSDPSGEALEIAEPTPEGISEAVERWVEDRSGLPRRGALARSSVERNYAWESISPRLGRLLRRSSANKRSRHQARRPVLAMFTPWNVRCGISEHAAYMLEAFEESGWGCAILGQYLDEAQPLSLEQEARYPLFRVWNWDNVTWRQSDLHLSRFTEALRRIAPDLLVVQHHSAYLPAEKYAALLEVARFMGIPVVLEFHAARTLKSSDLEELGATAPLMIVHSEPERELLAKKTSCAVHALPLPVRVRRAPERKKGSATKSDGGRCLVVAGFGFLRPHKRVLESIRIVHRLRQESLDVSYLGMHALYGNQESEEYYCACLAEIRALGMEDHVDLDVEYHDIDTILERLSEVDVVLLPYAQSEEGASAAANISLGAGRPLVTSASAIFEPLKDVVVMVDEDSIDTYAATLRGLVGSRETLTAKAEAAAKWAREHSYVASAARLLCWAGLDSHLQDASIIRDVR